MQQEQYLTLVERLDRIERLIIQATPPSRRAGVAHSRSLVATEPDTRRNEMLRLFDLTVSLNRVDKCNQHFPNAIIQPASGKQRIDVADAWRLCPRSILLNRASMRSAFRATLPGDDPQPRKNAERTLETLLAEGKLGEASLVALTGLRAQPTAIIYDPTALPEEFAGRVAGVASKASVAGPVVPQGKVGKQEARGPMVPVEETDEQRVDRLAREAYEESKAEDGEDDEDDDFDTPLEPADTAEVDPDEVIPAKSRSWETRINEKS